MILAMQFHNGCQLRAIGGADLSVGADDQDAVDRRIFGEASAQHRLDILGPGREFQSGDRSDAVALQAFDEFVDSR